MTFGLASKICKALGEDIGEIWVDFDHDSMRAYEATFNATRDRLTNLVEAFLRLAPEQQEIVTQMVAGVIPSPRTGHDDFACCLLSEKCGEMAGAAHAWDYDQGFVDRYEGDMKKSE